jgi:hypothetical protein
MDAPTRRAFVLVLPLIISLVLSWHFVQDIRTVDFLLVFASGAVFGLTLQALLRILRRRRRA